MSAPLTAAHVQDLVRGILGLCILRESCPDLSTVPATYLREVTGESSADLWAAAIRIRERGGPLNLVTLSEESGFSVQALRSLADPELRFVAGSPEAGLRMLEAAYAHREALKAAEALPEAIAEGRGEAALTALGKWFTPPPGERSLEIATPEEINREEREPVPCYLPGIALQDVTVLAGAAHAGKTYAVASAAVALVSGLPVLGEYFMPEAYNVLILQEEQGAEHTFRQLRRFAKGFGVTIGKTPGRLFVAEPQQGIRFNDPASLEALKRFYQAQAADGHPVHLTIIDSAVRAGGVTDIASATDWDAFYDFGLGVFRKEYGTGFLVVAHTNKSDFSYQKAQDDQGLFSGSERVVSGADAAVIIRKTRNESGRRLFRVVKSRRTESRPFTVELVFPSWPGTNPDEAPLYLRHTGEVSEDEADHATARKTNADKAVEILENNPDREFTMAELVGLVQCSPNALNGLQAKPGVERRPADSGNSFLYRFGGDNE